LLLAFSPSFFFLSSISIYNYNLSNKNWGPVHLLTKETAF
jgi:hypothetical protein